jgi:cation transport ATPase
VHAGILLTPATSADCRAAMALSSVSVVMNSLELKRESNKILAFQNIHRNIAMKWD